MTKEALAKLNPRQMAYCVTLSYIIHRATMNGLRDENERNRGKLRGFLDCLMQSEILSPVDMKNLYLYFVSEDRSNHERSI